MPRGTIRAIFWSFPYHMLFGGAAILRHIPIYWQSQCEELLLSIHYCAAVHYGLLLLQGMSIVALPSPK